MRGYALPDEVRGVEIEAQRRPVFEFPEQAAGCVIVEGDLGGMHFERELHAAAVEFVEDRRPEPDNLRKAIVHHLIRGLRERIPEFPYRAAHKACHHRAAHILRGLGSIFHLLNCPFADPGGVSPAFGRSKTVETGIPEVSHALSGEVRPQGPAPESVLSENCLALGDVVRVSGGPFHIHMIAPARDLHAVVPE